VQSILLSIITNPQVYDTLRSEIRGTVARGQVSSPIQDIEAKQLVYLEASVLEGLRIFPPLSQLRERVVPPGGDTLGGYYLPEGTFVGLNTWGVQRNKAVYGDNADLFCLERWLTDDCLLPDGFNPRLSSYIPQIEVLAGRNRTAFV
jgi:cytochrome P450